MQFATITWGEVNHTQKLKYYTNYPMWKYKIRVKGNIKGKQSEVNRSLSNGKWVKRWKEKWEGMRKESGVLCAEQLPTGSSSIGCCKLGPIRCLERKLPDLLNSPMGDCSFQIREGKAERLRGHSCRWVERFNPCNSLLNNWFILFLFILFIFIKQFGLFLFLFFLDLMGMSPTIRYLPGKKQTNWSLGLSFKSSKILYEKGYLSLA